jgi:isoleucyl-tRNA synthetase
MDTSEKKTSYKDTVNTPRTDFPMRAGLPRREPEILARWKAMGLYERIQQQNRDGRWFLLHDGPPYANGHIHMGTTRNKVLKDFVVKYKSMRGCRSPFVPGYDCHGLPIEHALFKKMGKSKHDVDRVEFHRLAREFATKWIGVQSEEFKRLGVLGTWDEPYTTMDRAVEAREIECFGRLAVSEGLDYVAVKTNGETLILAEGTLVRLQAELGWPGPQIVARVKGAEMAGLAARHPFYERDSTVILGSEYVTLDVGSGIIHCAPGHGHEDFIMGRRNGLEVLSPVDEQGRFVADLPLFGGQSVWEANTPIIEHLQAEGRLPATSEYPHSYPHCWRCKKPVIFRATPQWFLNVEYNNLRTRALEAIQKTAWLPASSVKRIGSMVEARPDWCLSRQRLWGVPVPRARARHPCLDRARAKGPVAARRETA